MTQSRMGKVTGSAGKPMEPTRVDHWARQLKYPEGGEAFGTKVTFWSTHWGDQRALITKSPKVESEREFLDPVMWQIAMADGGLTWVGQNQITLGWHEVAK